MHAPWDNADLLQAFGSGDAQARAESWRYSKRALEALSRQTFVAADGGAALPSALRECFHWPHTQGRRLVFINGVFSPTESDTTEIRLDVEIQHDDAATTLRIPAGHVGPVHLIYVNVPGAAASRWWGRVTIELLGGQAQLIEQHIGQAGSEVLGALVSTIRVHENAQLHSTLWSDLPDSVALYRRVDANVAAAARYVGTHAMAGGRLQRLDAIVTLAGERAGYASRGVFVLRDRQHADVHLDVQHRARGTVSENLWRGVADHRSHGIFHGGITVMPGADGADAQLSNKNLLLSDQAEIDTQPALEIYADEVKAAHGATVGQLDEGALFYLRARGIPQSEARAMLTAAFCRAAFDAVPDQPLRDYLYQHVLRHLPTASMPSADDS